MEEFKKGWEFIKNSVVGFYAADAGNTYVNNVKTEIDNLVKNLNSFAGNAKDIGQLKGDIAEFWHSGTYNINAALKGSQNRTYVDRSNQFASVDISSNFGMDFGLKYYKNGQASAKAQAKSIFEAFKEYQAKGGKDTFEEFLKKNGYSVDNVNPNASVYASQIRIVPKDQLREAEEWLKRKISEESTKRPEQVQRYKDTLKLIQDRIKDGQGTESVPLTKDEAQRIAKVCKDGNFKPEDFGIVLSELVTPEYIIKQAVEAGSTAALITMVLQTLPEICKVIDYLVKNGEINKEQLKKSGITAISSGAEGFLRGSIASALTIACKAGKLGNAFVDVQPGVIGIITVLVVDVMKNGGKVICGKMTTEEMGNQFVKEVYLSFASVAGGMALGMAIPGIGFVLGSFLGSVVGTSMIQIGEQIGFSYQEQAFYFQQYAARLMQIDIETFKRDTEVFNNMLNKVDLNGSMDEINKLLRQMLYSMGIELPWRGDFNEFMSNRNNRLVFE